MKILVYDIPAYCGGALTVLKECYEYACSRTDIEWLFVVSIPELLSRDHVSVICVSPETRRRRNRLLFEYTRLSRLCKSNHCDCIISLVNTVLPVNRIKQLVYMHNSIPFSNIDFSLRNDRNLWLYKHVIGRVIRSSMKKCDGIIIQTEWIKRAIMRQCHVPEGKFIKCPPNFGNQEFPKFRDNENSRRRFIYPAGSSSYKNHAVLFHALQLLKQRGIYDFTVSLTLREDDFAFTGSNEELLAIRKIGVVPHQELMQLYSDSVLVFPSKLETFGLPLLEARRCGTIVIASDMPFSREVLDGYPNSYFFRADDANQLADIMEQVINSKINYITYECSEKELSRSAWDDVIAYIDKHINM